MTQGITHASFQQAQADGRLSAHHETDYCGMEGRRRKKLERRGRVCENGCLAGNSETVPGSGDLLAGHVPLFDSLLHTSLEEVVEVI